MTLTTRSTSGNGILNAIVHTVRKRVVRGSHRVVLHYNSSRVHRLLYSPSCRSNDGVDFVVISVARPQCPQVNNFALTAGYMDAAH